MKNEERRKARAASSRKFRLANPGYAKAAQAKWYAKNREKESLRKKVKWAALSESERQEINRKRYTKAKKDGRLTEWRVKRYGLTIDEFVNLSANAKGRCMSCNQVKPLVIDHNHATGRVRGLLCAKCNVGIGQFNDDPSLLRAAAEYLVKTAVE